MSFNLFYLTLINLKWSKNVIVSKVLTFKSLFLNQYDSTAKKTWAVINEGV